jgi:plasmid stabilization system protein ParE
VRAVRFHDAARLELRHEVTYYTLISPVLGRRLAEAVEEAIGLAVSFPEIGSAYLRHTRRVLRG